MPKTEIAGKKFDFDHINYKSTPRNHTLFFNPTYINSLMDEAHKSATMFWDCKDQTRDPDPFPNHFVAEPRLLIYCDPHSYGSAHPYAVSEASFAAGKDLLKKLGLRSPSDLNDAIVKTYGTHKVPFDVDKAIEKRKPTERLNIRVSLRYMHIELRNPKIIPYAKIILSLPDHVSIRVKITHTCKNNKQYPKDGFLNTEEELFSSGVRAETEESGRLRKKLKKDDLSDLERRMEALKKEIAKKKKAIEQSEPDRR